VAYRRSLCCRVIRKIFFVAGCAAVVSIAACSRQSTPSVTFSSAAVETETYDSRLPQRFRDHVRFRIDDASGRSFEGAQVWLSITDELRRPVSSAGVCDKFVLPDIEIPDHVWITGALENSQGNRLPFEYISDGEGPDTRLVTATDSKGRFWLPVRRPIADRFYLDGRPDVTIVQKRPLVLRGRRSAPRPYARITLVDRD